MVIMMNVTIIAALFWICMLSVMTIVINDSYD
jgi:hypothetical protein